MHNLCFMMNTRNKSYLERICGAVGGCCSVKAASRSDSGDALEAEMYSSPSVICLTYS